MTYVIAEPCIDVKDKASELRQLSLDGS